MKYSAQFFITGGFMQVHELEIGDEVMFWHMALERGPETKWAKVAYFEACEIDGVDSRRFHLEGIEEAFIWAANMPIFVKIHPQFAITKSRGAIDAVPEEFN